MSELDTVKILAVLKATYPNFYRNMPEDEIDGIISIWAELFAEDDPAHVAAAVKALISADTKGFPPHIGAVKDKLRKITNPELMTETEAWNLVYNAIKRGLYNSMEEYDRLPPMLQRLVGNHSQLKDWALMDADTVQSVVASLFQRSYKARVESERELSLLSPDVRELIGGIAERISLGGVQPERPG